MSCSRCKENERKELILAINKRFLSNLNFRNIAADELIENVKILPNSNTIGWITAYGNILNIIVNNKWKQKDMEGKTGNLTNDNWNSKINVAPNYDDATLPKMDIQIKNNYFKVNANKEISTIDGNNVTYTGKYNNMNNMPNYTIDNMNINQVEKFKIVAHEIKLMKEFSKNKLVGNSISEISNIMASQQSLMKPIFGNIIFIQTNLKSNYFGIKISSYTDKFWKKWNVNCNIGYNIICILKLSKDIKVKEIKLPVEKYSINAIYTKFRIIGSNIDILEGTKENIWEIIYIKDKIKIYLKLNIMEYDLFQMEEIKIQLMVLIIQNKYQLIQQMNYYGKEEHGKTKWLVNKEYIMIKIRYNYCKLNMEY